MTERKTTPDPVYILRGSTAPITSLHFASSDILLSGNQDGTVIKWDMKIRRPSLKLEAHSGRSVLWISSLDTGKIITHGRDGQLLLWSARDSQWTQTGHLRCNQHGFCPSTILDHADRSTMLAAPGEETSQVNIVDSGNLTVVGSLSPDTNKGMCMALRGTDRDSELLVGYEDGSVALWDIRTLKMCDQLTCYSESIMCMDYKGDKGLCGSVSNTLLSWRLNGDRIFEKQQTIDVTNEGFSSIRIRNDGKIVATAGWDGNVRVFGFKKLKPLAVLDYHKESVQTLTYSPDNLLACGSKDCHISLWDLYR